MARIRTIKPEFWTDEKIVSLPFEARLLFIGIWNFADDEGLLIDEPERIRLQIFPSDLVDIEGLLDLLVAAELLERVALQQHVVALLVVKFQDHQKISNPTPSKIAPKISGKLQVRTEDRRKVAIKYGCSPGETKDAQCYCCGLPGKIWWPLNRRGNGHWVAFSGLELSHFIAESKGGATSCENLVLCCRKCNRSMRTGDPLSVISQNILENSRPIASEGKGVEWNGTGVERKGKENFSGEPEEPATPPLPADVAAFPCVGQVDQWTCPQAKVDEWRECFPAMDVLGEVRKARQWLLDNPGRRKTARGMTRFLFGWLERTQNRSGASGSAPRSRLPTPEEQARWNPTTGIQNG